MYYERASCIASQIVDGENSTLVLYICKIAGSSSYMLFVQDFDIIMKLCMLVDLITIFPKDAHMI